MYHIQYMYEHTKTALNNVTLILSLFTSYQEIGRQAKAPKRILRRAMYLQHPTSIQESVFPSHQTITYKSSKLWTYIEVLSLTYTGLRCIFLDWDSSSCRFRALINVSYSRHIWTYEYCFCSNAITSSTHVFQMYLISQQLYHIITFQHFEARPLLLLFIRSPRRFLIPWIMMIARPKWKYPRKPSTILFLLILIIMYISSLPNQKGYNTT